MRIEKVKVIPTNLIVAGQNMLLVLRNDKRALI